MSEENFYIARDADGSLYLHGGHPRQDVEGWFSCKEFCQQIGDQYFPEVKPGECYQVKLTLGNTVAFEIMG